MEKSPGRDPGECAGSTPARDTNTSVDRINRIGYSLLLDCFVRVEEAGSSDGLGVHQAGFESQDPDEAVYWGMAQLVAQDTLNVKVAGSSPAPPANMPAQV